METNNQTSSVAQSGAVDYAAVLRQYSRYSRGRSMKTFCEDEGDDYWKFCELAREGQIDLNTKAGEERPGFVEVKPDGAVAPVVPIHRHRDSSESIAVIRGKMVMKSQSYGSRRKRSVALAGGARRGTVIFEAKDG